MSENSDHVIQNKQKNGLVNKFELIHNFLSWNLIFIFVCVFQAKKFVEGVPQVIKGDIGQDEAEKLKKTLEAVGGICEIS